MKISKQELNDRICDIIGSDETVILADGFEEAIIGVGSQYTNAPCAIYDREKCIEILTRDMSHEEAIEYFEFNVQQAYVGEATPMFIDRIKFDQDIQQNE
jgi:hypothetical protein